VLTIVILLITALGKNIVPFISYYTYFKLRCYDLGAVLKQCTLAWHHSEHRAHAISFLVLQANWLFCKINPEQLNGSASKLAVL
jgi:hypothetical protein